MNYAALLALLAALAFTAPFLVNIAATLGLPRALGIVMTLAGATFLLGWVLVRERVERRERLEARIGALKVRLGRSPGDPESFFWAGEHLGDLLTQAGRPREALRAFEAYNRLLSRTGTKEAEQRVTETVIASLRRELAEREEESDAGV